MKKQANVNTRLDLLASQTYNDPQSWKKIRQRNGKTMPFGPEIKVGQLIQIPQSQ